MAADPFAQCCVLRHGLPADAVRKLWDAHGPVQDRGSPIKKPWYLTSALRFLKLGLPYASLDLLHPDHGRTGSPDDQARWVEKVVWNGLEYLDDRLDLIRWDDRLDPLNSHPDLPPWIRTAVDTVPIYSSYRANPRALDGYLYQPKYAADVWKVTSWVAIGSRRCVALAGIDPGPMHDGALYDSYLDHPTEPVVYRPGEYSFADGVYGTRNPRRHLLTPFTQRALIGHPERADFNHWLGFHRAKAEHWNAWLFRWRILRDARCGLDRLAILVNVCAQLNNLYLDFGGEYEGFFQPAVW